MIIKTVLNALWPGDAIWQYISGSTFVQVMACCLTAPTCYLHWCLLLVGEVLWHSALKSNFTASSQAALLNEFENHTFQIIATSPGVDCLNIEKYRVGPTGSSDMRLDIHFWYLYHSSVILRCPCGCKWWCFGGQLRKHHWHCSLQCQVCVLCTFEPWHNVSGQYWCERGVAPLVLLVNSLWLSDTIWHQISWSALVQVMACCLIAPSHYRDHCWLIISEILWHSPQGNFTWKKSRYDNVSLKITNFRCTSGWSTHHLSHWSLTKKIVDIF